jgi:hypothetical protein
VTNRVAEEGCKFITDDSSDSKERWRGNPISSTCPRRTRSGPAEPVGTSCRTRSGPAEPVGTSCRTRSGPAEPVGTSCRTRSGPAAREIPRLGTRSGRPAWGSHLVWHQVRAFGTGFVPCLARGQGVRPEVRGCLARGQGVRHEVRTLSARGQGVRHEIPIPFGTRSRGSVLAGASGAGCSASSSRAVYPPGQPGMSPRLRSRRHSRYSENSASARVPVYQPFSHMATLKSWISSTSGPRR